MSELDRVVLSGDYPIDVGMIVQTLNSIVSSLQKFSLLIEETQSNIQGLVARVHNIERIEHIENETARLKEEMHVLERSFTTKLAKLENNLITTIERQKAFAGKVILVGAFLQIILTSAIGTAIAYIMKG